MGNSQVFRLRLPALSTAALSSAALAFTVFAGMTCSFVKVTAGEGEDGLVSKAVGEDGVDLFYFELMETGLGLYCDSPYFERDGDVLWELSRIMLTLSLALGGCTFLMAWALSLAVCPTDGNWKFLSLLSCVTCVLQVPVFLMFETKPCSAAPNQCTLSTGCLLLVASTVGWILITLITQCTDPPLWAHELNAWRLRPRSNANNNSTPTLQGYSKQALKKRRLSNQSSKLKMEPVTPETFMGNDDHSMLLSGSRRKGNVSVYVKEGFRRLYHNTSNWIRDGGPWGEEPPLSRRLAYVDQVGENHIIDDGSVPLEDDLEMGEITNVPGEEENVSPEKKPNSMVVVMAKRNSKEETYGDLDQMTAYMDDPPPSPDESYYADSANSRLLLKVESDGRRPGDDLDSGNSFASLKEDVRMAEAERRRILRNRSIVSNLSKDSIIDADMVIVVPTGSDLSDASPQSTSTAAAGPVEVTNKKSSNPHTSPIVSGKGKGWYYGGIESDEEGGAPAPPPPKSSALGFVDPGFQRRPTPVAGTLDAAALLAAQSEYDSFRTARQNASSASDKTRPPGSLFLMDTGDRKMLPAGPESISSKSSSSMGQAMTSGWRVLSGKLRRKSSIILKQSAFADMKLDSDIKIDSESDKTMGEGSSNPAVITASSSDGNSTPSGDRDAWMTSDKDTDVSLRNRRSAAVKEKSKRSLIPESVHLSRVDKSSYNDEDLNHENDMVESSKAMRISHLPTQLKDTPNSDDDATSSISAASDHKEHMNNIVNESLLFDVDDGLSDSSLESLLQDALGDRNQQEEAARKSRRKKKSGSKKKRRAKKRRPSVSSSIASNRSSLLDLTIDEETDQDLQMDMASDSGESKRVTPNRNSKVDKEKNFESPYSVVTGSSNDDSFYDKTYTLREGRIKRHLNYPTDPDDASASSRVSEVLRRVSVVSSAWNAGYTPSGDDMGLDDYQETSSTSSALGDNCLPPHPIVSPELDTRKRILNSGRSRSASRSQWREERELRKGLHSNTISDSSDSDMDSDQCNSVRSANHTRFARKRRLQMTQRRRRSRTLEPPSIHFRKQLEDLDYDQSMEDLRHNLKPMKNIQARSALVDTGAALLDTSMNTSGFYDYGTDEASL